MRLPIFFFSNPQKNKTKEHTATKNETSAWYWLSTAKTPSATMAGIKTNGKITRKIRRAEAFLMTITVLPPVLRWRGKEKPHQKR